ncbi:CPBP family intramembrane glutamic endopeptidase [Tenacibaculum sp. SG-28]|uniref:CPBP family intramembrane glutamic endopeptidase n=1 Tax=Tenacibaculum sp. SG-28 TaxID=754426 RepID=UPI000CF43D13|nr:CPBP family intramembrane glutamic endopeptidase [Tenacibaculum sp. SG-28]PQJ20740.1 CAAX protease [Tenacibaculum sp. SG-28]
MKRTLQELATYLKSPVLEKDPNKELKYRFTKFLHLLVLSIGTGIILTPIFYLLDAMKIVNMQEHAVEDLIENFSKPMVFILAGVIAPIAEEIFFRAPLTAFKNTKHFFYVFYAFALFFGFVHISNFEISTTVILLAPLLVAPQIILGCYLGFIRIRFGLLWSILLHASYNAFFIVNTF